MKEAVDRPSNGHVQDSGSTYLFAPSLGAQDGGANKASGSIDEELCTYRHFFVDATA
jgi:hypothetical protein